ncbi:transcription termination factor Rho [Hoyosella sp. YIM 151337]|uniref:transcription termination factor Rho n=1 Tax=Hoyosella sp. YIM 151337 TaxID=2992742 RepID=UPI002235ED6A|nr:transcription termination factor Rho [Hoyosella sp. YIM 151337]MCW4355171.1 transcription termination factor Rho [Hoyosella sp. YIM 151337]
MTSPNAEAAVAAATKRAQARKNAGLAGMVLAELRALAGNLGIRGTSGMRKGELIAAIQERQRAASSETAEQAPKSAEQQPAAQSEESGAAESAPARGRRRATRAVQPTEAAASVSDASAPDVQEAAPAEAKPEADEQEGAPRRRQRRSPGRKGADAAEVREREAASAAKPEDGASENGRAPVREDAPVRKDAREAAEPRERGDDRRRPQEADQQRTDQDQRPGGDGQRSSTREQADDDESGRGRRGRRFRERRRGRDRGAAGPASDGTDTDVREDDVLQPVAGILDVLDNYAFVRTSGYLAGPNDVYVSMNMVRKNGLRRGDAITGAVRVPKEGEQPNQRQKFNPLVRLDSINGMPPEQARKRPEFGKLTPLYPNERLRLETTPNVLTTRVIDLIMPIGKGQRALIVSPPKAGKTTILQDVANAIAQNNPECYLMVVLVDERPEEVTDMQRSVRGEVISSTFDRPPSDHTSVAELAIERAKRLVEIGKDVVVLLDSITRLGRAYNNSSPASGRILSGGVDSTALYPPKRFLGAARNIEEGGSLTIIATAMVETGSQGDTVIFEEFKGTGNAELKLDRRIAERRVFPAVDVIPSGTRRDDLLLNPDEFGVVHKLRRVLSGLDSHQAIDLLIDRLKKSKNNLEFLMQVAKTAPGAMGED